MHQLKNKLINNSGQTLIETVIGIFILVTGIAAAVGLAVFALAGSQSAARQIVAIGLAREGVEAVKNMRDTNWLKQTAIDTNCYNPKTTQNTAKCYKSWLGTNGPPPPFCLDPTDNNGNCNGNGATIQNYYLGQDATIADFWVLIRQRNSNNYGLNFDPDISGLNFKAFYTPSNTLDGSSDFYRKIIITEDDGVANFGVGAGNPFNKNTGPKIKVQSQVWWTDNKKCPRVQDWPGEGKCSVELQTFLTNWKDY